MRRIITLGLLCPLLAFAGALVTDTFAGTANTDLSVHTEGSTWTPLTGAIQLSGAGRIFNASNTTFPANSGYVASGTSFATGDRLVIGSVFRRVTDTQSTLGPAVFDGSGNKYALIGLRSGGNSPWQIVAVPAGFSTSTVILAASANGLITTGADYRLIFSASTNGTTVSLHASVQSGCPAACTDVWDSGTVTDTTYPAIDRAGVYGRISGQSVPDTATIGNQLSALTISSVTSSTYTRLDVWGQSLAEGACSGSAPECQATSTSNPNHYGNQLVTGTGPNTYATLRETGSVSGQPEPPRSGFSDQFAFMSGRKVLADDLLKHGGWSYAQLAKGQAIYTTWLASVTGMSNFGSSWSWGGVSMLHGQQDFNVCTQTYSANLVTQQANLLADSGATTLPMFLNQWNAWYHYHSRTAPTCNGVASTPLNILQTARHHFGKFYPAGPQYQFVYFDDVHIRSGQYVQMSELNGKVAYHVLVGGHKWTGTQPREMSRSGATITARMWECAADADLGCGPLAIDTTTVSDASTGAGKYGFEYFAGWQGTATCAGTDCTRVSGDSFPTGSTLTGQPIKIMGAPYTVDHVVDADHLVLTTVVGWRCKVTADGTTSVLLQECPQGVPTDGSWNGNSATINGVSKTISSTGLDTSIADGAKIVTSTTTASGTNVDFVLTGVTQTAVAFEAPLPSLPTISALPTVSGDTMTIVLSAPPSGFATERLRYAYTASGQVGTSGAPRGNIRDSDPTLGQRSGAHLYDWLFSFDDPLPFAWAPPAQGLFPQPSGFKRVAQ